MLKFNAWYNGQKLGLFESVGEAQQCIIEHSEYKKSWYTKRGKASSSNPNQKSYFAIYDTQGYGWNIR